MDGERFDAFTKMLAGARSRRTVLLAGAASLTTVLATGRTAAAAGCKRLGKKCRADTQCCSGAVCRPVSGCGHEEGATACCIPLGGPCSESCDCCGTDACVDGVCVHS